MKIILTFDYEIFFGREQGTVDDCLIRPTELLDKIAKEYDINLTFFVDVGYLIKLKEYARKFRNLEKDFNVINKQLETLARNGHSLQLHIHPHWEKSYYDGEKWNMNHANYKLQSFSEPEIFEIVKKYKGTLENISRQEVFIFRAGGWCVQPFEKIKDALYKNNVYMDSSVIPNSLSDDYNFQNSPQKTLWNFELDPNIESKDGSFVEIPISSIRIYPLFYWRLLFSKVFKTKKNKTIGNGTPINPTYQNIFKWLLFGNYTVVSSDGLKSNLLIKALENYEKVFSLEDIFTTIGHPKATTNKSIENIRKFVSSSVSRHNFVTYEYFKNKVYD